MPKVEIINQLYIVQTLEGWKLLSSNEPQLATDEFLNLIDKWAVTQKKEKGSRELFQIIIQFKKLEYEMCFDEVSAHYGEFGSFFVVSTLSEEKLASLLQL